MNRILAITGMTGVGKDFLVSKANADIDMQTVNLGTLIGDILQSNRDRMMDLTDAATMRAAQQTAYKKVVEMQPLIVTCHAIREQENGYGYVYEMEKLLNPMAYVFVAAPANIIAERVRSRNQKGARKSAELSVPQITELQELKLNAMKELAQKLGCELVILNNTADNLSDNIAILSNYARRLLRLIR